ncbi:hypothetical protein, partial [Nocardia cyriacigeorgica]|uniref:hypothetical protein n=1 Tax=Nocardia cyriacigeorgica TaxID=135487 RepID=UPI00245411E0
DQEWATTLAARRRDLLGALTETVLDRRLAGRGRRAAPTPGDVLPSSAASAWGVWFSGGRTAWRSAQL